MKKIYIAPASQSFEVQCSDMLALSLNNSGGNEGGSLGSGDFDGGDFEYNAPKKGYWDNGEW